MSISVALRAAVGLLLCSVGAVGLAVGASETPRGAVDFQIAAGRALAGLEEFSQQSGLQVLVEFDVVNKISTRAVTGHLEPSAALHALLKGTRLSFEVINARTVVVVPEASRKVVRPLGSGSRRGSAGASAPEARCRLRNGRTREHCKRGGRPDFQSRAD